jgi:hypothetical protein
MRECQDCGINFQGVRIFHQICLDCWIKNFDVVPEVTSRLKAGEYLHQVNCADCKKYNCSYCEKCAD